MRKKTVSTLVGLSAAALLAAGCSMCEKGLDDTGPVPDSENFHNYKHAPRVNSAIGGPVVEEYGVEVPADAMPME